MLLLALSVASAATPAPVGWSATAADWRITLRPGEPVEVRATYTLTTPTPGAGELALVGPGLVITDASGPVSSSEQGLVVALGDDRTTATPSFAGRYEPPSPGSLTLPILPAARTHVVVDAPGLDVTIPDLVDGWLPSTGTLVVTWAPHVDGEPSHPQTLVRGEAATTFRGDAGAVAIDSVLRWQVVRGSSSRFTFSAAGLEELEVSGPNVASWERTGDTVTLRTKAPVQGLLTVGVRGRGPAAHGTVVVPTPAPEGVQRLDRYVTMARSDEGELIPVATPSTVALARMPVWARDLGESAPLAAWHGSEPVQVLSAAYEALDGPDTVVTDARYTFAATREGRAALRMNLRVRNERRQYLHFRPGPTEAGDDRWRWTPIVVRVGNQPVSWLSDGDGGIYVPLGRSVETVKGLLSFPVDVEWIGEGGAWEKRGEQDLRLPSVDAPVQHADWEVHLPRGFRAVVPRRRRAASSGFAVTDLRAPEPVPEAPEELEATRRKNELVSSALQNAVSAYQDNDFDTAQRWLDQAHAADDANAEVAQLQSNLDVLAGVTTSSEPLARRVKDLAKAKTGELAARQETIEAEAEALYRAGDLDRAEAAYAKALDVANELQKTEQAESVDQKERIAAAEEKLAAIRGKRDETEETTKEEKKVAEKKPERPAPKTSVTLSSASGKKAQATSDDDGRFDMPALEPGEYEATFDADGDDLADDEDIDAKVMVAGQEAPAEPPPPPAPPPPPTVAPATPAPEAAPAAAAGVPTEGNPSSGGAATNENTYLLDGVHIPDPVSATYSTNFNYDAVEEIDTDETGTTYDAENDASAVTEDAPVAAPAVVTKDFLMRIPAARSYEDVVTETAGVAASPGPAEPGSGIRQAALATSTWVNPEERSPLGTEKARRHRYEHERAREQAVRDEAAAHAPAPVPPAPGRDRHAPLAATPSPMALALPLDGPAVATTQALLPADTFPTWALPYREAR